MGVLKVWNGTAWENVAGNGPAGAPGPTAVSADAGNGAVLGTDGLIHVPGVVHRFASTAERDALLPAPVWGDRCVCGMNPGELNFEFTTAWEPKGVLFAGSVSANVVVGVDSAPFTVPLGQVHKNVGNVYNGTNLYTPVAGLVKFSWSAGLGVGSTAANIDLAGMYHVSLLVYLQDHTEAIASCRAQFGMAGLSGVRIANMAAGHAIYPQVSFSEATGLNKSVQAGIGSFIAEYI